MDGMAAGRLLLNSLVVFARSGRLMSGPTSFTTA
jgi:hypothetical protein